jgi:hypothetical protein
VQRWQRYHPKWTPKVRKKFPFLDFRETLSNVMNVRATNFKVILTLIQNVALTFIKFGLPKTIAHLKWQLGTWRI